MSEIRVVIIEQSEEICDRLNHFLNEQTEIEIINCTNDRDEGLKLMKTSRPNLAIIDIFFLKESDWDTALFKSIPVIILARPLVDEVAKTLRAISLGAVDFINKIDLEQQDFQSIFISKVNNAIKKSKLKLPYKNISNNQNDEKDLPEKVKPKVEASPKRKKKLFNMNQDTIIAIGTSTGGPKALQTTLEQLPEGFPAPIFIVQHMPSGFTKSLAKRLNRSTDLAVQEAKDNDIVQPGTVYIAPGNYHMVVTQDGNKLKIRLNQDDVYRGHRPSVDILFNSIAHLKNLNKIAVVLTGMGRDGAEGVKTIKQKSESAVIIAESKQSAIIFGMPQAAIKTNCVTHVAHIKEIGPMIKNYVER